MSFREVGQALAPRKLEPRLLRDLTQRSNKNRDVRIIRSFVANAFQGGKMKAVRELKHHHDYGFGNYDLFVIQQLRTRYISDLEKIRADSQNGEEKTKNQQRLAALAAALIWQAFNLGKLSSFRQRAQGKITELSPAVQAQADVIYEDRVYWVTEGDEKVCEICLTWEARSMELDGWSVWQTNIPSIPYDSHPFCRCEYETVETRRE